MEGDSRLLDVAREVSAMIRTENVRAAVIGGVAVVLHGHVRTTADVDIYVDADISAFSVGLRRLGFRFQRARREFTRDGLVLHLVTPAETGAHPIRFEDRDGVRTVSLPDLINMKLRSGLASITRAQDLADVIGLIRARKLTSRFAARLEKDLRPDFRRLVRAVRAEDK